MTNQSNVPFEIIAERQLEYASGGKESPVFVRIGKPYDDGECWACPFQIIGIGSESIRPIYGQDSVQAIQLAMFIINSELEVLDQDNQLTFLGQSNLGFPRTTGSITEVDSDTH